MSNGKYRVRIYYVLEVDMDVTDEDEEAAVDRAEGALDVSGLERGVGEYLSSVLSKDSDYDCTVSLDFAELLDGPEYDDEDDEDNYN